MRKDEVLTTVYPSSFDHMLRAWNVRDPELVRGHPDPALSDMETFVDPTIVTHGIDEFEANVREFRGTFPDACCYRTSGFDGHYDHYRYSWAIDSGGATIIEGFDVVELDSEQRSCEFKASSGHFQRCRAN